MENIGIERRVDELGRIVLPIEFRRILDIKEKDILKINLEKDSDDNLIELRKCLQEDAQSELFINKVDELGRILLPIQIRCCMKIEEKEVLEVSLCKENSFILIRKCFEKCIFSGATEELIKYKEKYIPKSAIENLVKLYNEKYGDTGTYVGELEC